VLVFLFLCAYTFLCFSKIPVIILSKTKLNELKKCPHFSDYAKSQAGGLGLKTDSMTKSFYAQTKLICKNKTI
jgi:hypothetical protein